MYQITNITKSPISIMVKCTQGAYDSVTRTCMETTRAFTTKIIPGLGSGKNVFMIEDEKMTDYIKRLEPKFISIKKLEEKHKKVEIN